ncbi:MAG: glycosyltransferase family 4 protein [Candidatus Tectomicrobia bacterium]|uniref:Glycosyltransferase family 4 protein n=1 Tax=Tectimicrobiota bacterium TaxID=2528274 RepID=A0A932MN28_UNCTE|nr:glycosyltransferase family 4 protein [Candidatus Tectomicrobia bacterium]
MRILVCNEQYAPAGGAEVYLLDVMARLEARCHEVGILHDAPAAPEVEKKRPAFRVPGSMGFVHDSSAPVVETVRRAVEEFAPDVLYLHQAMNPAVNLALAGAAPFVQYVHGLRLTCPTGRRLPRTWEGICEKPFDAHCLWKAHTQLCMPRRPDTALRVWTDVRRNVKAARLARRVLAPSRYVADLLVRGGTPQELVEVLPYYTEIPPAAERARPAPERRVLALGRLEPEKGFQHLIEALPLIEAPAVLEIVGEGPFRGELERLARQAPERHRVIFTPWVAREKLSEVYARARTVAFPSTWPETFGLVGIEAMAHGLPVAAFEVGGVAEWMRDGATGALVPRKDVPALARALDAYLSDGELALRHGAAGREEVRRRFLPERHLGRLEEVLAGAAARARP